MLLGGTFDLALLDNIYGQSSELMKGTKVCGQLRQHERRWEAALHGPKPTRLLIIGVTGEEGSLDFDHETAAVGMDAVWGKPFPSPEKMRDELAQLFASRTKIKMNERPGDAERCELRL